MQINRLARFAAAAALGASVAFAAASPALADSTISIQPGNVPTPAQDAEQSCDSNLGGGPYIDKDVWVFNLPSNGGDAGEFTSVTANFDTNNDGVADTTVVIEAGAADGDDIVFNGTSKAYAITPAGWTLISATATITGTADFFVLTHTCAAGTSESSSPPTTTPTTPPSSTPPTSPSTPTSSAPGGGGGNGGGENGGGLPITGVAASSIAVVGAGLIGTGAVLLLRRRRKFVA